MITGDYCSYEVAKLLKEKGFPQEYDIYHSMVYNEEDYEDEYEVQRMVLQTQLVKAGTLSSYPVGVPEPKCYCPTHQETKRWLLKKHNIFICVLFMEDSGRFGYTIEDVVNKKCITTSGTSIYKEPEEAEDGAIKLCLEKLI